MVYNNYEGLFKGFDHWQVSVYTFESMIPDAYALVLLQVSIPRVTSADDGTYYCAFYDASTADYTKASFAYTIGLTLATLTKQGSSGVNLASSRKMDYSFALISAIKVVY